MNNHNDVDTIDPDDLFKDTRMSFGDHLEDLRAHLIRALIGFVVGMVISLFFLGQYVMHIIVSPVEEQLDLFEKRVLKKEQKDALTKDKDLLISAVEIRVRFNKNQLREALGMKPEAQQVGDTLVAGFEQVLKDLDATALIKKDLRQQGHFVELDLEIPEPQDMNRQLQTAVSAVRRPRLATMNITEAFMVYFKVAMMTGFVISSPWVFYHVWAFIAAGLYPTEKRLVNIYLPFSLFLFISGVLVCQFLVMPRAIAAMLWFNEWLGLAADLRLNEWLSFALMMPIVFGLSFQTPLVMMFVHKIGLMTVQSFRDKRRAAWFVMAIFAALITPSVDAFSMLFLWVPMGALYELGILLCIYQGEDEEDLAEWEKEERQRGELVEV